MYAEFVIKAVLGLFFLAPFSLIYLIKNEKCRKYGLHIVGTLLLFAPFAVTVVTIYLDITQQPSNSTRSFGTIDYAIVCVSFFICLLSALTANADNSNIKSGGAGCLYSIWVVILVLSWLALYALSTLICLVAAYPGRIF